MRSSAKLVCWSACLGMLAWGAALAPAQVPLKARKIEIQYVGPPAASESLVRSYIRVKAGETFRQSNLDDDIRNLYATGYFRQIQVEQVPQVDGVDLIYKLQGKPRLTNIKFTGNKKFSDSKLQKKCTSKVGEPLDVRKLFNDAQELQKLYQKSGYHRTTVKHVTTIDEPAGRGSVTFEVNESPKVKIERVEFIGAQAFPEKKLRKVVNTRKYRLFSWLFGKGRLKDDVLEDDKDKLIAFYQNEGYIDFELKDVKVDSTGPKSVIVRFIFTEGRQYKVGAVAFKGNALFSTNELAKATTMTVGQTFTPKGLEKDLGALRDKYGARGYIFPETQIREIKTPNVEKGTIDLTYQISEGEQSIIEKIEIRGNTKTKDKVIRRELTVAPGEVFDMVQVKLSEKRLQGLNYFEKVETRAEPTTVRTDKTIHKNLTVAVDETRTGQVTFGAGLTSIDALVGYVEYAQGNFDLFKPPYFQGGGQKFRLRTMIGTERQDYVMSFIEPWFLERKLALGVELFHRELYYVSPHDYYNERHTGGRLSLRRALYGDNLIGSVSYTLENVGVIDMQQQASPIIRQEEGHYLVSKLGGSLAYDTRDHVLMPTKGYRVELETEVAGGPFMGDCDFYKLDLRSVKYLKGFFEGHLIELSGRAGVVESFGDSTRVPIFERFFLGGLYSMRGFDFRDVGPVDETGEPLGGGTYWFGSVEYTIPIIERLRIALFYDIGKVYGASWSLNYAKANGEKFFNDNWGVGIRLMVPHMGPLRFDFGVPISHDRFNGSSGKFNYGIGFTREF